MWGEWRKKGIVTSISGLAVFIFVIQIFGCSNYGSISAVLQAKPFIKLPQYPWPPEDPSSRISIDQNFIGVSLWEVSRHLERALKDAAYFEYSYYSAPGGFAMVTRLEAVNADGTPLRDERRYELPGRRNFSFVEQVRNLFFAPEGYYRFIAFVVTDLPYLTSDEDLAETEALERLRRGAPALDPDYENRIFSRYHRIEALIYEFRKGSRNGDVETLRPGRLPPQTHLENSGLAAGLLWPGFP